MNALFDTLVQFGPDLWKATLDTFLMVGVTMLSAVVLGTPLGVMLFLAAPAGLYPRPWLHKLASYLVNALRARTQMHGYDRLVSTRIAATRWPTPLARVTSRRRCISDSSRRANLLRDNSRCHRCKRVNVRANGSG